jgi:hypothetical protein
MKRSKAVPLGVVATVASLALTAGCGKSPTHRKVCGDANGIAVEPEKCDEQARHARGPHYVPLYHWYYGPYGRNYSVGSPLTGLSRTIPTGSGVRIAEPVRAGFGGSAHAAGS